MMRPLVLACSVAVAQAAASKVSVSFYGEAL